MIIITGASGKLGSQVVERLLVRVPADQVAVSVRDPDQAADAASRGVRVRHGDFSAPETLVDAFDGASVVFVVSSSSSGSEAVSQHLAAIDAAYAAGAGRVVYTSHQACSADSLFAPMIDHAATEAHLAASGRPFTSLRNGFYASTVPMLLGPALSTGELVAPADGPVSWTGHADLAEAAAVVLAGAAQFDGPTPPLTAAAAVDLADVATQLSQISGRTIRRVVADDEEWVAQLIDHGVPESGARMLLGMFEASRRGEFAVTDPTLGQLVGREPQPVATPLAAAVEAAATH